jgi:hypothetical protein
MLNNKKIIIGLPAYNSSLTLEKTYRDIPFDVVDDVILVDEASTLAEALFMVQEFYGIFALSLAQMESY